MLFNYIIIEAHTFPKLYARRDQNGEHNWFQLTDANINNAEDTIKSRIYLVL